MLVFSELWLSDWIAALCTGMHLSCNGRYLGSCNRRTHCTHRQDEANSGLSIEDTPSTEAVLCNKDISLGGVCCNVTVYCLLQYRRFCGWRSVVLNQQGSCHLLLSLLPRSSEFGALHHSAPD